MSESYPRSSIPTENCMNAAAFHPDFLKVTWQQITHCVLAVHALERAWSMEFLTAESSSSTPLHRAGALQSSAFMRVPVYSECSYISHGLGKRLSPMRSTSATPYTAPSGEQGQEDKDKDKDKDIDNREPECECLGPESSTETLRDTKGLLVLIDKLFAAGPPLGQSSQVSLWEPWKMYLNDGEAICRLAEELAGTDAPYRVYHLLQLAHASGARFNKNVYERIAFRLAEAKQWRLLLLVTSAGIRATGKASSRILNWRARAFVEAQHFALLDTVLGDFATYGLKPQRRTFQLILRGHLLNHDLARAKKAIQDMELAGFAADLSTHTVIASVYRGLGPDKYIEDRAYEVLGYPNTSQKTGVMNSLLRLYLDKDDLDGAIRLLESFESRATLPASNRSSIAVGGERPSVKAVPDSNAVVLKADCTTYSMLIDYLSRHRNLSWLSGVLQRMRSADVIPDGTVAAALVRMHYAHGSEKSALDIVLDICKPFNLDVRLLERLGYDQNDNFPSYGPFHGGPTVELFNSVMEGALHMRGIQTVHVVLQLMQVTRISPNGTTLDIFMSHLDKSARIRPREVIRILRNLLSFNVRPTLKHLNTILSSVIRSLSDRSIKADRATFALRMRYDTLSLPPDQAATSAANVLQEMRERGLHPNVHHYAALVDAHCAGGDFRAARAVMQDALTCGALSAPNSDQRARARGAADRALSVFQEMLREDVAPDVAAIHAVVGAFFAVKAFRLARRVLIDLWPMVAPFPEELREASLSVLAKCLRSLRTETEMHRKVDVMAMGDKRVLWSELDKIIMQWKAMPYGNKFPRPSRPSGLTAIRSASRRKRL
ncbi:hypothetical protein DFH11DRAFT_1539540 [Phellopilus nigrolimitatus]|nr:hypothetical protein DFH11DRAFT_1539540 [Phellopilus nigrolimitatus]